MRDVIRNPNRRNPQPVALVPPEYQRLGIIPTSFPGPYASQMDVLGDFSKREGAIEVDEFPEYEDLSEAIDSGKEIDFDEEQSLPKVGQYILMINGEVVESGEIEVIEARAKEILYGEDLDYQEIAPEKLVVLKRVNLKVGVYIQD